MPWQARGLRQSTIARILSHSQWYVSGGIRNPPRRAIVAIILVREIMTPAQRVDWLAALDLSPLRRRQPVAMRAAALAAVLGLCRVL